MDKKKFNKILLKAFGHNTFVVIKMSRADADALGLFICECGHPKNNHFDWNNKPCAHCGSLCVGYREKLRVGKLIKPKKEKDEETNKEAVRKAARKRRRSRSSGKGHGDGDHLCRHPQHRRAAKRA